MNNATLRLFSNINRRKLRIDLQRRQIVVAQVAGSDEHDHLQFLIPVGHHQQRWKICVNLVTGDIVCSGNASKTVCGNNIWVTRNEAQLLDNVNGDLWNALQDFDGLNFRMHSYAIDEIELGWHYEFLTVEAKRDALSKIRGRIEQLSLMPCASRTHTRFDICEQLTKAQTQKGAFHIHDPIRGFDKSAEGANLDRCRRLRTFCRSHVRLSLLLKQHLLESVGLDDPERWTDLELVDELSMKQFSRLTDDHYVSEVLQQSRVVKRLPDGLSGYLITGIRW